MKAEVEDIYQLVAMAREGFLEGDSPVTEERFKALGWLESDRMLTASGRQYLEKALAIEASLREGISIIDRKRITTVEQWQELGKWFQFRAKDSTHKKVKLKERYPWHVVVNAEGSFEKTSFLMIGEVPDLPTDQIEILPKDQYGMYRHLIDELKIRSFTGYAYEPTLYQRKSISGVGVIWMVAPEQRPIAIQESFYDMMMAVHPTAEFYAKHNVTRMLTVCDRKAAVYLFSGLIGAIGAYGTVEDGWPTPKLFRDKKS